MIKTSYMTFPSHGRVFKILVNTATYDVIIQIDGPIDKETGKRLMLYREIIRGDKELYDGLTTPLRQPKKRIRATLKKKALNKLKEE